MLFSCSAFHLVVGIIEICLENATKIFQRNLFFAETATKTGMQTSRKKAEQRINRSRNRKIATPMVEVIDLGGTVPVLHLLMLRLLVP